MLVIERVMNLLRARFIRHYVVYARPSFSLALPQNCCCWSIIINEMENFGPISPKPRATRSTRVDRNRE